MKKIITLLITILVFMVTNAQDVKFEWAKQMGGTDYGLGYSIITDATGNIYTTGLFSGTTDFDPSENSFNLTSVGNSDIFISKMDSSGNLLWAKQIGGLDYEYAIFIDRDKNENLYITGNFRGNVDFNPGLGVNNLTAIGASDSFVVKLDNSGNFLWAKQFGGTGNYITGHSLDLDSQGNVYITGDFTGTVDFDPSTGIHNLTSAGSNDIYIAKLNSIGNLVWAKRIGSYSGDEGVDIKVDTSGDYLYVTGAFRGTVDFNPDSAIFNLASSGSRDIYILKLASSGSFVWAKKIGDTGADRGHEIALDNSNNHIYITGEFSGNPDFDPGTGSFNLSSAGGQDCFVEKLDMSGNFVWARAMGGPAGEEPGNSIKLDSSGNVIVTGWFWGTSDFDPSIGNYYLTSQGSSDVFIVKLNPEGTFVWAKHFGGADEEVYVSSWSSALDTSDNIFTTGGFEGGEVDFDPGANTYNLSPLGNGDIFIHKMSADNLGINENNPGNNFKIYPNPTSGPLVLELKGNVAHYSISLINQLGQIIPTDIIRKSNRFELNFNGKSGLYFLKITNTKGLTKYLKVLKK
ncbi:MAG: T9SS type A sorting domain-containing protein [Flavobacteriaceae bacterium]|nr:T9SS type A sorting domain-containing protein [Flavobacteriaceae bacterium]